MTILSKGDPGPVFCIKLKDAQDRALEKSQKANILKQLMNVKVF